MILTKFRNQYETASLRLGQWCSHFHLKPNTLTLLSFVFGILAGIALWFWYYKTAILCMAIAGFLDIADGATARYLRTTHPFGTVLDRVNDRYVEFVISLGLVGSGLVHPFWILFSLFGAVMASYTRASAESWGKVKNCAVGFMERQEKGGLFLIGIILEPIFNPTSLKAINLNPFEYSFKEGFLTLQISVIIVGVLSHITVLQRLAYAKFHENET